MADLSTPSAADLAMARQPTPSDTSKDKSAPLSRPERPDEEKYKEELAKSERELKAAEDRMKTIKSKLELARPNNKDSPTAKKQQEYRNELSTIRTQQQSNKSGRTQVLDKIKRLDENMKSRIAEQKTARSRVQFKSADEVQKEIDRLQKQVDTGTMKIVDEKKALADISQLNRQKKGFAAFDEAQKGIDDVKAQIAELKKSMDDPESKALSDRYTEITTELDKIKAEADEADTDDVDEDFEPAISSFKIHTRTISAFQFAPHDPNALFSCSYDSSIRKLDLQKGTAVEVYAPADKDADEPLSGVEISRTDPHTLHFTTLHGGFGMHDTRTPSHQRSELMQLSDKKIGGFSLHPAQPHLLATASLDRTLKLWDLRKITGKGSNRQPILLAEHTSSLSVSHAAFNSAGQVATASYDDTVKIYDCSALSSASIPKTSDPAALEPSKVVPHNNQTGRWVTILRAQWQLQPQDGIQRFVIGNMNRFVDVYTGEGKQVAQLGGEGVTAVPAVAQFHPTQDWVGSGTASGKLCLWM